MNSLKAGTVVVGLCILEAFLLCTQSLCNCLSALWLKPQVLNLSGRWQNVWKASQVWDIREWWRSGKWGNVPHLQGPSVTRFSDSLLPSKACNLGFYLKPPISKYWQLFQNVWKEFASGHIGRPLRAPWVVWLWSWCYEKRGQRNKHSPASIHGASPALGPCFSTSPSVSQLPEKCISLAPFTAESSRTPKR